MRESKSSISAWLLLLLIILFMNVANYGCMAQDLDMDMSTDDSGMDGQTEQIDDPSVIGTPLNTGYGNDPDAQMDQDPGKNAKKRNSQDKNKSGAKGKGKEQGVKSVSEQTIQAALQFGVLVSTFSGQPI